VPSSSAGVVKLNWPANIKTVGYGFYNLGNTCFLNSALQCQLHTPPLLNAVLQHRTDCMSVFPPDCV
jgi:ubiquitin carboxyl-terminal hydrolase 36/42